MWDAGFNVILTHLVRNLRFHMQQIMVQIFRTTEPSRAKNGVLLYYESQSLYESSSHFVLSDPVTQDSGLVWAFYSGLQQALVCLTCLYSSVISSQD